MQIDDALLTKLEKLSSLKVESDKRREIEGQLSEILSFAGILDELDLSASRAVVSSREGGTPLREDVSVSSDVIENDTKKRSDEQRALLRRTKNHRVEKWKK